MLIAGFCIIVLSNPVTSVFFLIVCFFCGFILFLIFGAEFLSILILIVYIGAVSVLFLFVIMMMNLRLVELKNILNGYIPVGGFIGFLNFISFVVLVFYDLGFLNSVYFISENFFSRLIGGIFYQANILYMGWVFYNFFYDLFLIVGFILLVSMLGSIVLTLDYSYKLRGRIIAELNLIRLSYNLSLWRLKFSFLNLR